ncbi:hypothetical protein PR202_gb02902 [Eleusine coracana subsp. coracana]|uniref:Uncharacterized protein n=1 Tax=Eleusine coracana subsp. coracana TaxID=191504 RepID=A0AAV5E0E3_ELECO|nr:hypothetical protein PR202_gb02902 [Eleusine coracana subsp. coracana]
MSWPLTATRSLPPLPAASRVSLPAVLLFPSAVAAASLRPGPAAFPKIRSSNAPGTARGMSSASSAESEAAGEFTEGHLDVELNDIGRQQAVAVVFNPALRERNIGDLQGMTLEAAAKEKREAYKAFLCHKRNQEIPDLLLFINLEAVVIYVQCYVRGILLNLVYGKRVIVVSHGGTIRELYRHASPMKPLHGKIHNTSVSVILVSGTTGRCIVKMVGDISHLQGTGVLENGFGGDNTSA